MRERIAILVAGVALAGCSVEIPGFLGRTGSGEATFQLNAAPLPDPQPIALRSVRVEPALRGVILRAEGVAPTQGYHSAAFTATNAAEPDAAGILEFRLTAIPPATPATIGPERTRELTAAFFLPAAVARGVTGFRVAGVREVRTLPLPR